jgi:C-terminal processing protease CtpA/Prc
MRNFLSLFVIVCLSACSGGESVTTPQTGTTACSNDGQKQFVLDSMNSWYLWNDLLPTNVDLSAYASAEELLAFLITVQTLDNFSFINSAAADAQFFGEGKFEGFGFSSRFEAADDLRLTRVFAASPAANGGLGRGQRILSLNGRSIADIQANEGLAAVFDMPSVTFEMRRLDNSEYTASITQDIVTILPVPQWRIIDAGNGRNVGYMEFATFISTAIPEFATVFAAFRAAGVNDVIIDLRYNGGGLVSTAELLGDYFGGSVAQNLTFSRTEFNADRAPANDRTELFELLGDSMSLSRLVVIATQGTASASELVTNSMIPQVDVTIVGDRTFGKPVGQVGLEFCDKILRPTAFQTVNADGIGDYFGGLPVDCPAADDLSIAVGDDLDPNMIVAMAYLDTGACPAVAVTAEQLKTSADRVLQQLDRRGPPHRELLDAF